MSEELIKNKYLNSFTILSYNPNNFSVSFKQETLLLDDTDWLKDEEEINSSNEEDEEEIEDGFINNEEYWIIDDNGKNSIIYRFNDQF